MKNQQETFKPVKAWMIVRKDDPDMVAGVWNIQNGMLHFARLKQARAAQAQFFRDTRIIPVLISPLPSKNKKSPLKKSTKAKK